jgi:1,4-dihydroxy-6-naphthoate synthase
MTGYQIDKPSGCRPPTLRSNVYPLTLAHSPDPDDVFMWWPITGKIDPRKHGRVVEPPVLDTGRFAFRALPADIDVLNRRAIDRGDLDITALSIFAWSKVADRYALTCCGSSFGEGYGPKLVARESSLPPNPLIAIPGTRTTAFLLLTLALKSTPFRTLELPFDQILDAVTTKRADAGLLIHQSQLTYAGLGLIELLDLGAWWHGHTGLPLPLGGNALRRDLDQRFGPGTLGEITAILDRSIRHALLHRDESTRYAMLFAPEITRAQADRYIDMYVSPLTIDAGERGRGAIQRLLDEAAAAGLAPPGSRVEMIRPG